MKKKMIGTFEKRDDGYFLDIDFGIVGQTPYPSRISGEIARTLITEAYTSVESTVVHGEIPERNKQHILNLLQELLDEFD